LVEADDPSETTQGAIHVFELGPEVVRLNINVTSDGNQAGNAWANSITVETCWNMAAAFNVASHKNSIQQICTWSMPPTYPALAAEVRLGDLSTMLCCH